MADETKTETPESGVTYLQLVNQTISFVDPETGFRLVGDQIAECPTIGVLTGAAIRTGAIVEVAAPAPAQGKGKGK